jgi:hypothetical protein
MQAGLPYTAPQQHTASDAAPESVLVEGWTRRYPRSSRYHVHDVPESNCSVHQGAAAKKLPNSGICYLIDFRCIL